jgi:MFS family permease
VDSSHSSSSTPLTELDTPPVHQDPYLALRYRNFRLIVLGSFITSFGFQMLEVAIGWEIYERTSSSFALGLVGLVSIIPIILFSLLAGYVADTRNRLNIIKIAQFIILLATLGLALVSFMGGPLILAYLMLFTMGCANAFSGPAASTLIPLAVPSNVFPNAATWSSSAWQLASVVGPACGGFVIALTQKPGIVYICQSGAVGIYIVLLMLLTLSTAPLKSSVRPSTIASLKEGLDFLRKTPIIMGAITLDMFAVLLGGATTLLPIFARDILQVGPQGLGWLRAAPSIGAIIVVFLLAHRPPFQKSGRILLWCVAGFGVATVIFGISTSFWLSLIMLAILGGLDNVSVVIRSTLMLVGTPDKMRGRVSSVNSLFISMSNQLGGFESGTAASIFGPILSVIGGGIGTVLVVIGIAWFFPALRGLGRIQEDCVATQE